MKEKAFSLTGDDFTIKTTAGMEVCKCKGKVLSISDKKGMFTASTLAGSLGATGPCRSQ